MKYLNDLEDKMPYYPLDFSNHLSVTKNDYSSKLIDESSEKDIDKLEVYKLKEKLRVRDKESTLPDLEDVPFLKDLGLIVESESGIKLTVAGALFVGKEGAIHAFLPQSEVIYLHYSDLNREEYDNRADMKLPLITILDIMTEKIRNNNRLINIQVGLFRIEVYDFSERVFQEALLNAMSHRSYENNGAIYVKHYSDRVVIENPGGFPEGINERNIITHPSNPRNKLIAETLQRLKYVQRSGQGVDIMFREMISMGKPYPEYSLYSDAVSLTLRSAVENEQFVKFVVSEQDTNEFMSLSELMILRYLSDNRKLNLSEAKDLTQLSEFEVRRTLNRLIKKGLIQILGREYMLTARVYEDIKSDVQYTQDKIVQYLKAKSMIIDYIRSKGSISNGIVQELCGFSKDQAYYTLKKMKNENLIIGIGKGKVAKYIIIENNL